MCFEFPFISNNVQMKENFSMTQDTVSEVPPKKMNAVLGI